MVAGAGRVDAGSAPSRGHRPGQTAWDRFRASRRSHGHQPSPPRERRGRDPRVSRPTPRGGGPRGAERRGWRVAGARLTWRGQRAEDLAETVLAAAAAAAARADSDWLWLPGTGRWRLHVTRIRALRRGRGAAGDASLADRGGGALQGLGSSSWVVGPSGEPGSQITAVPKASATCLFRHPQPRPTPHPHP